MVGESLVTLLTVLSVPLLPTFTMASELVGQRLVHGSKNGRHEDVAEALAEIKKKYKKKKDRLTVTDLILDDCIYQFTPLMWSVRHNHVKCLDLLLDGGASVQTRCKHGGFTVRDVV